VDAREAATGGRVVEAREVVVDERRGVEELDRDGGPRRDARARVAHGGGDDQAQAGAEPLPAREQRVDLGGREPRWTPGSARAVGVLPERALDAGEEPVVKERHRAERRGGRGRER
jgi:hypothetical protein